MSLYLCVKWMQFVHRKTHNLVECEYCKGTRFDGYCDSRQYPLRWFCSTCGAEKKD